MFSLMWLLLIHIYKYPQEEVQIKISSWATLWVPHFSQLEALFCLLCYKTMPIFVQTTLSFSILILTAIYKDTLLHFLTWLDYIGGGRVTGFQDFRIHLYHLWSVKSKKKALVNLKLVFSGNHNNSAFAFLSNWELHSEVFSGLLFPHPHPIKF